MRFDKLFCAGSSKACVFAGSFLCALGLDITDEPSENVKHLLLDIPSFRSDGHLRGGGVLTELLSKLPKNVTVYGGNLKSAELEHYRKVDFLQDEAYLAENAYITAECALDTALPYLDITLRHCPVLILGWGRIGKCLGQLLKNMGADVTIAARRESDLAMAHALGYHTVHISHVCDTLTHFRLIYNTIPAPVLNREQMTSCHPDCVKIELASVDGMDGEDVIIARGLPGLHMPESSGKLIAQTFIRLYQKEDQK